MLKLFEYDNLTAHVVTIIFRCAEGFYGDPRPGSRIGCKPCMCPGGAGSGVQHADSCKLDTATEDVVCDCHPGYKGNVMQNGSV